MYKHLAHYLVPDRYHQSEKSALNNLVRFCTVLFNPLTLFCVFLYFRIGNSIGSEDFFVPEEQRISSISWMKMVLYFFFPNLTFYYWNHLALWQVVLHNVLGIPDCLVIFYYVYSWNVSFRGVQYLVWLIYKVSCFFGLLSLLSDYVTYDIDSVDKEKQAIRAAKQRGLAATEIIQQALQGTQVSRVMDGLNIANMNMLQMENHKDLLKKNLKQVEQIMIKKRESVGGEQVNNNTNSYQASTNLKSETCIICMNNEPVYRFVPCYHCCLCENCVHTQLDSTMDVATFDDEDDIVLDGEDAGFSDALYRDDDCYMKCETSMKPCSSLNKCPVCKTSALALEYTNMGIKKHLETRELNSQYHVDGCNRGKEEVKKLFKAIQKNRSLLDKLKQGTRDFLIKNLTLMKVNVQ